MRTRLELHAVLTDILGAKNVYFQPPENIKMKYPCIIYEREGRASNSANDKKYIDHMQYKITVVDKNPDSLILNKVAQLQYCRMSTHFVVDNLNHDIFTIYW